jgi:hypothetical protein
LKTRGGDGGARAGNSEDGGARVPGSGYEDGPLGTDGRIRRDIGKWRDGLVNLTGVNRLLNFKPTKAGMVAITRPTPSEVLARVGVGRRYDFRALRSEAEDEDVTYLPPPPSSEHLDVDRTPGDLAKVLRGLYRRSNQAYLDQGLSVLYLAFGVLAWADVDKTKYTSPLLLVPVTLETAGVGEIPVLKPSEDDALVNPALTLKLGQLGIELPRVDSVEDGTLESFLADVRRAVAGHADWLVREDLTLSVFSFAKEAMYRDLLDNEDLIAEHDVIAALALGGSGNVCNERFDFDQIPDAEIDERADPETTPVILDADSSQRACIAAALAGKSFVMDGPPGTGKSQTIANMIGVLLHAGKTVLFVSEKAAALDVVRNRLAEIGLGPYLLELHSAKATRKQVADELGRALTTEQVPPDALSGLDLLAARTRRQELNQYADAMNRPRYPLGSSLHEVLGWIAALHHLPAAPLAGISAGGLTVEIYSDVKDAAQALAGAWRPARQGGSFLWRGVTERGSMDARLYRASSALAALAGIVAINSPLAEATGLTRPSDASALAALLDHLHARPPVLPGAWLTTDRLAAVGDEIDKLDTCLSSIATSEQDATLAAGVDWRNIPQAGSLPIPTDLSGLFPRMPDATGLEAEQLTERASAYRTAADMFTYRLTSLAALARMLGLRAPGTFAEADDLLAVARLNEAAFRPERIWLTADGLARADTAATALRTAIGALEEAEAAASTYYTHDALTEDLEGLTARVSAHHGLGKLSAAYREDKKTVAAFTVESVSRDKAQHHLGLAVGWKKAAERLAEAERTHARILGAYYNGRPTDFTHLAEALRVAETAARLTRGQDTARVAECLARDAAPSTALRDMARDIARDLRDARTASMAPPELFGGSVSEAVGWLRRQVEFLDITATIATAVSNAVGRQTAAGMAGHLRALRDAADAAHHRMGILAAEFRDTFGELYQESKTDISAIRQALDWVRQLRKAVGGTVDTPLTDAQVKTAASSGPTPNLAHSAESFKEAAASIMEAFDGDRRYALSAELDDYEEARHLIEALQLDTAGKDEWHAYQRARDRLAAHGLSGAVDFCVAERIPAQQAALVIERALLQEWAEDVLRSDPALSAVRASERNALIAEYRKLDRAVINAAVGNIIRACNRRRPRTDIGESAIIRREAEKKRRHMPVRTLLERSRNAAQAIKPCFMMSPLTVSQFLPPDLHFDAVIFDEASQVMPGDAINCIYRGSALILAGDQKQLPPTSWLFSGMAGDDGEEWEEDADDTGDFESVLDIAKSAGVFRSLTLRWHRRSRHESLIAFSNFSFYDGKILTFPSARSHGPDVGVELIYVPDGCYRRGTSRDNPVEAEKVAERVLRHYDTRPTMSLGVVAFSEAQAGAIDIAVTKARGQRPDLDRFFNGDDRLHGFFVKNLESIQGDERDVLIFSIGYGPDENGKFTMGFGPLNRQGGWRRLNVAITRAHYRNEIVSSIRASDIPESVNSAGVRHLRRYLDYAERGMAALALDTGIEADAESPFEESVINVIRSWGYDITPQVGTAGFRIDIGVRHPSHPGAYALGVECDGFQYHSSRAARDRDRLREDVLRGLGWRLHRIWGTAWYRDRNGAEAELRDAIEQAVAAPVNGLLSAPESSAGTDRPVIDSKVATFSETPTWTVPYVVAPVPPLASWVDPGGLESAYYMVDAIRAVVECEGPIHIDILHERLRVAWDIGRIGKNIRTNIDAAIRRARVLRTGDFLSMPDGVVAVRTPTDRCKRSIGHIDDVELLTALARLVVDAAGISNDELTTRVARIYGWERVGSDIAARLRDLIGALLDNGVVTGTLDNLTAAHSGL